MLVEVLGDDRVAQKMLMERDSVKGVQYDTESYPR